VCEDALFKCLYNARCLGDADVVYKGHGIVEGLMAFSRAGCNRCRGLNCAHIDPRRANCSDSGCGRGRERCASHEMNALLLLLLLTLATAVTPLHLLVRSLAFGRGTAARGLWHTTLPSGFVSGFVLYSTKLVCCMPFVAVALVCFVVSSDDAFHLREAKKANVIDAKDHGQHRGFPVMRNGIK
jgi:hypothetical protein